MRRQVVAVMWGVPILAIFTASVAMGVTVLDFEDLPAGTTVKTQYGPRGVIFGAEGSAGHYLDQDPAAHSGMRVLRTVPPHAEVFTAVPLVMTFTSAQARVKLFAGSPGLALNGTLTAFDAGGNVVAQDGPRLVAADVFTTLFEVMAQTPSITRAELRLGDSAHFAIDDLEFDGDPPGQVPTIPPVVQILSPANGVDRDLNQIDITGTVTGDGLLSPVTVTMASLRPPESTAPPFTSAVELTGSGTTRQFALAMFGNAPLGPITITVTAENTGGLKGTATSTFTNLPDAIRNRFTAEGGAAALGAFRFGLFLDGCKMAVYDLGAISTDGSTATQIIRGDLLPKWLSIKGLFNQTGFFGCPLGDERDGSPGSRVQDFQGGRIYKSSAGTFYVPAVFVDAIDKRGGEAATGVPLADPTSSAGPMQTWLFQQFTRLDRPGLLPSTLEIRGTPPTLWIERQGGDLSSPFEFSATLWENFGCLDNLGPCSVDPPPPFPPENISNAGTLFCNGTTYWPGHIGGPPEWVAIPSFKGDWVATPAFGVIRSSFMADIDNVFTHETHNANCPYFPDTIFGATLPIGAFAPTCASDFEFKIRPIGPQPGAFPYPSLFGKENLDLIKVEYEVFYAAAVHNFLGAPQAGDLIYATGRWIIDCGHSSYKSELHPLFSFAKLKAATSVIDPFTGLEQPLSFLQEGQSATRADVWVNGWYPGGEGNAIEFDIFPPPRPSPDAVLHIVKPVDADAARDVSLEFSFRPPGAANHVHVKLTSPYRENEVTDAGEMMWEHGRRYWGMWFAYWTR